MQENKSGCFFSETWCTSHSLSSLLITTA